MDSQPLTLELRKSQKPRYFTEFDNIKKSCIYYKIVWFYIKLCCKMELKLKKY